MAPTSPWIWLSSCIDTFTWVRHVPQSHANVDKTWGIHVKSRTGTRCIYDHNTSITVTRTSSKRMLNWATASLVELCVRQVYLIHFYHCTIYTVCDIKSVVMYMSQMRNWSLLLVSNVHIELQVSVNDHFFKFIFEANIKTTKHLGCARLFSRLKWFQIKAEAWFPRRHSIAGSLS